VIIDIFGGCGINDDMAEATYPLLRPDSVAGISAHGNPVRIRELLVLVGQVKEERELRLREAGRRGKDVSGKPWGELMRAYG